MAHDEIFEVTGEDKEHEWLPYLKNDVLSTLFCYAKYSKGIAEVTGFGMKISLTLPSLANKYFNSLRKKTINLSTVITMNNSAILYDKA